MFLLSKSKAYLVTGITLLLKSVQKQCFRNKVAVTWINVLSGSYVGDLVFKQWQII